MEKGQKGPPRTFRNLKEEFEKSMTKHKNGKMPSRNTLKKYHNVKHLPIQVRDDQLDIPISKLYPPPHPTTLELLTQFQAT